MKSLFVFVPLLLISGGAAEIVGWTSVPLVGFAEKKKSEFSITPVAYKSKSGWKCDPFWTGYRDDTPTFSEGKQFSWSVVYDGNRIGTLVANPDIEKTSTGTKILVGWVSSFQNSKLKIEPAKLDKILQNQNGKLLVASIDSVNDPENWKLDSPPATLIENLKKIYLKKVSKRMNCKVTLRKWGADNQFSERIGKMSESSEKMTLADVIVDKRAFRSSQGKWLIGLKAKVNRDEACLKNEIGSYGEPIFYRTIWYGISSSSELNSVVEIPGAGVGLNPFEAYDIDGDGKTEWIFNRKYGMNIFSNNFTENLECGIDAG